MKALIQTLVEVTGPSGYEHNIRDLVKTEVKPLVDDMYVDNLGNLITKKGTKGKNGLTVMVSAHLDEIGIMVTHIDDNGFARFTNLGGVYPRNLAGGRVRFMNGAGGVVYLESHSSATSVPKMDKMYIDLGVSKKANSPVKVGDVAAFERTFMDLGDRIVSKALDDRIGVAILIETLRDLNTGPNEIVGVFSVQEEVGVRGATTAAFGVEPDLGIAIDVTAWGDTPNQGNFEVGLGKGPAIKVKDGGMIADPRVVSWMEAGAKRSRIPVQREVLLGGSTDARAIQISRAGVPAGCVSIPCRYVHSPSEMVDYNDTLNAVKLLRALLSKPIKL